MLAVYDRRQSEHEPLTRMSGGGFVPSLETPQRATLLLEGLAQAGIPVVEPADHGVGAIRAVHDADYLDFLENGFATWSRTPSNGAEMRASAHPHQHMRRKPRDLLGLTGYFQADASCPLMQGTWNAARASANTAVDAMKRVLGGAACAYALCRPPGHHAYSDKGGGFCYLNNTAIAAELAAAQGCRVAIVDIDVHHGNGTQGIFYDRADVLTVSVHADPADAYPFYAGYQDERGIGLGEGCNLNLPVPLHSRSDIYLDAVASGCEAVRAFGPDVLVVALGLDAAAADPFACMAVDNDGFRRIAALLGGLGRRMLVVQEGGYASPALPGLLGNFLSAAAG